MWSRFDDRFPIQRAAFLSSLLVMLAGVAIGMSGFLDYAWEMTSRTTDAFIAAHGDDVLLPGSGMAILPVFLLATPMGLLSLYLIASGFLRAVEVFLLDHGRGDPVLTLIDAAWRGMSRRVRDASRRRTRERLEGPTVPDRLVSGARVGRPDVPLVLLASRAKPDWAAGSYLVGHDGTAHRIGAPFDYDTPAGLRTAYPLTPLTTLEPIRHAIAYDLPRKMGTDPI